MAPHDLELRLTEDGSHTIYVKSLDETYHSIHGSIQESRCVFIQNGLKYLVEETKYGPNWIEVLEVGFGTGLNAFLALEFCQLHPEISLKYTALEPYPIPGELLQSINHSSKLNLEPSLWDMIHSVPWFKPSSILSNFSLSKLEVSIEDYEAAGPFHLVFFDAFAPGKQPEIWSKQNFEKLYGSMVPQGVLTTYCAQGAFKRNLRSIGFEVQSLPGPPGKHEMVRALKS